MGASPSIALASMGYLAILLVVISVSSIIDASPSEPSGDALWALNNNRFAKRSVRDYVRMTRSGIPDKRSVRDFVRMTRSGIPDKRSVRDFVRMTRSGISRDGAQPSYGKRSVRDYVRMTRSGSPRTRTTAWDNTDALDQLLQLVEDTSEDRDHKSSGLMKPSSLIYRLA